MSNKQTTMFGKLPSGIFQIFTGPNRNFYEELLEYLDIKIFGIAGEIVSRREALSAVGNFIAERGQAFDFEEEETDFYNLTASERKEADRRRYVVFNRCVNTGWLMVHKDRYKQIVDFDPDARLLLQALLEIKSGNLRSYGGEVLQIYALLQSALKDPDSKSENVKTAARAANSFRNHLRSVSGATRKIESILIEQYDLTGLFNTYFNDFVSEHLIEDFKRLRTKENPFRFRSDILEIANDMNASETIKLKLAEATIREGRATDISMALLEIEKELYTTISIFEAIDDFLEILDQSQSRIERKIGNATRYMERIGEAKTERIIAAITGVSQLNLPNEIMISAVTQIIPITPAISEMNLYQKPRQRRKPERRALLHRPRDPALIAYEEERLAYFKRARLTYDKIQTYLENALGKSQQIDACDLPITSLDDFFAFERLRDLPYLAGGKFRSQYQVNLKPEGRISNEWIDCPDFQIIRIEAQEPLK